MRRSARGTELRRAIGHTKVTFISILLFVGLALAAFLGVTWSATGFAKSVDGAFVRGNFHHFEIEYAYGVTEDEIEGMRGLDGVDLATGIYKCYPRLEIGGDKKVLRLVSLAEGVDTPTIVEGKELPTEAGQIAVDRRFADKYGITVGQTLSFVHDGTDTLYTPERIINGAVTGDPTEMQYLKTPDFTVTAIVETVVYISPFVSSLGVSTPDSIPVSGVMYTVEDSFLSEAFFGYSSVLIRSDTLAAFDNTFGKEYKDASAALENVLKGYMKATSTITYTTVHRVLDTVRTALHNALDEGKNLAESVEMALRLAGVDSKTISNIVEALDGYVGEADDLLSTFDAKTAIVKNYDAVVSSRKFNTGYVVVDEVLGVLNKVRFSMAALFIIVGLLVSYSAISRLVYESTREIGTKSALGFRKREIAWFYIRYALYATLGGIVLGTLLGRFLVEEVVIGAMQKTYSFGEKVFVIGVPGILLFFLFEFAVQTGVVLLACRKVLKRDTSSLLNGAEPPRVKNGWYEKTTLWQKLSLLSKTIVKNCLSDGKRVFATVVGVAGCTALVVCALTVHHNVLGSVDRHYDIITYDRTVFFEAGSDTEDYYKVFGECNVPAAAIARKYAFINAPDGTKAIASLYVTEDENFYDFYTLYDKGGNKLTLNDDGVFCALAYGNEYKCKPGDLMDLTGVMTGGAKVPVAGFFEYHIVENHLLMTPTVYETCFEEKFEPNAFLIRLGDGDAAALVDRLTNEAEGFLYMDDRKADDLASYDTFAYVFDLIVLIYISLSVVMAFLVLYNLYVMFIAEKKKELIVMMINGFSRRDAEKYIKFDNIFLAAIGIVVGAALGVVIGLSSVAAFNNITIDFMLNIHVWSIVLGVVFSAVLSFLTMRLALRKVKHFSLTDLAK